jgi:hypothetical protein
MGSNTPATTVNGLSTSDTLESWNTVALPRNASPKESVGSLKSTVKNYIRLYQIVASIKSLKGSHIVWIDALTFVVNFGRTEIVFVDTSLQNNVLQKRRFTQRITLQLAMR